MNGVTRIRAYLKRDQYGNTETKISCNHCNGTGICREGKLESNCCRCGGTGEHIEW